MKLKLQEYLKAAFHARPFGMFVSPNWLFLAGVGLMGLLDPAFLLLGAGLELGYLYLMCTNSRFRRIVEARQSLDTRRQWQDRIQSLIHQLTPPDQQRYRQLEGRCNAILNQQASEGSSQGLSEQGQGLGRLLWIYLRLLIMRQSMNHLLSESTGHDRDNRPLPDRIEQIKAELDKQLADDLRKSLTGQLEILEQRLAGQVQAREKLAFLEAELMRIQEQVELIREQAVLTTDPQIVSQRIDQVAATLGGTTQWIREQQQIYGQVEDLLNEPPAILPQKAVEKQ